MKVCLSNPTFQVRRPVKELDSILEEDTTVLTPTRPDMDSQYESYNAIDLFITQSEWPIPSPTFLWHAWKVYQRHDVIHMWVPLYLSHTYMALLKPFFPDTKLILTMDTVQGYSHSRGVVLDSLFGLYYATLGRLVYKAADAITLYSESFKPHALKANVPEETITYTPTGVHLERKEQDMNVRNNHDIPSDQPIITFVGLLNTRKGIPTLLDVARKRPRYAFLIVGDGPKRHAFQTRAPDNVTFTGYRDDVHNYYHAADAFILPSRGEGFAGVIMEAMKYSLPVVASKIPGNTDLVDDGTTGYLCKQENTECYANAIDNALKKPELGEAGRKRVEEQYSWEKNIDDFTTLYHE